MHLAEILDMRNDIGGGVSIGLTRRCPLSCAHCSTRSTMESEEAPAEIFTRFVGTFRRDDRPEILALSGGEALLRPDLVQALASTARKVGTRTSVLSGLFFARADRIPPPILRAVDAVDHFSTSFDVFHEPEVPRDRLFRTLGAIMDRGVDVSLHLVGQGADDPWLGTFIGDVRRRFDDAVPMVVNALAPFGRARDWLAPLEGEGADTAAANPCAMAAWPVVGFDGTVSACGNDDVFDRRPAHLLLGHAATDGWPTIRARTERSALLRAIRLFGPRATARRLGRGCDGYCAACMALDANAATDLSALMDRPATRVLERGVQALLRGGGGEAFLRRHGIPRFAGLSQLGRPA